MSLDQLSLEGAEVLFVVYPSSSDVFDRFFPALSLEREHLDPMTFLYVGQYSPGILGVDTSIVTIPAFPGDFTRDQLLVLMEKIQDLAVTVDARGVALAGILPGMFYRYSIPVEPPCVTGRLGTVYAVVQTLRDALKIHGLALQTTTPIRILGYGYVGQWCLEYLKQLGCMDLVVIERRLHGTYRREGVIFTNSQDFIREDNWVIFVAGGGNDVDVSGLPRIFGINDMYPPFSLEQMATLAGNGSVLYEVALCATGVISDRKIEQFSLDQFPGCLGHGLVQGTGLDTTSMSQAEFDEAARTLGIRSSLA